MIAMEVYGGSGKKATKRVSFMAFEQCEQPERAL